jgi:RND family efflux transporter MFP subunit
MEEPGLLQSTIQGQQADLAAARADLEFSRKQLGRYQALLEDHTVSARDTEQYRTTVSTQEQRVKSIQANIASQRSRRQEAVANIGRDTATLQSARANLAYYTVRAPFTGVVGTLSAKQGDVVDPTTVLTTLTDNRNLEIDVAVSADDRARIHLGMSLELLSMRNEPLGEVQAFYIDPKVDPMTQTFLLKAKSTNPNQSLSMDQHLKVRLIWERKQAILVPLMAVFRLDGQPFVYRAETALSTGKSLNQPRNMVARMQVVTLGDIEGDSVIVKTGLKSGDTVVQTGIQKLQDGAAISQAPPESNVDSAHSAKSQE